MTRLVFLDTNILIYATLPPDQKSDKARGLLGKHAMFSVQVLNEFANVARRKLRRSWPEINQALSAIRTLSPPPIPITLATHTTALRLAEQTAYRFYDALILASALNSGCSVILTEDLQDGQMVEGRLTIQNPFSDPTVA